MIRIGSALFNADHGCLGDEVRRMEQAGVDFFHLDVFDGYFVRDQAFPARTIQTLRKLTKLPFEIHLAVEKPEKFLAPLREAGADLVYLPAESTPLLYETIFSVRESGMEVGLCLALGTSLEVLRPVLTLVDSVLLLGRVTGEGQRGRDFNSLLIRRVEAVRRMIDESGVELELQAAGGLETDSCVEVCRAGATALPLGSALHRESDARAYLTLLKTKLERGGVAGGSTPQKPGVATPANVLVASRSFGKNCPETLEQMKAAGCVFLPGFEKAPTEEQLISRMSEVDVLISGTEPVTGRVIENAPRLKVIAKHGVGVDNIDLEAARSRKIPVAVAGPAMVDAVADLTFGLLLAGARQIPQGDANVKAGKWDRFIGPELRGKTLGIVGCGQIGKAVARRAFGFGLNVIAFDEYPDIVFSQAWGVRFVDFDALLKTSDFVTVHAPLTPRTRKMFGPAQFGLMKKSAFLISMARGELIDEEALFASLKSGQIAGAAVDVFVQEPPGNNPLLSLPNFIAMPHCGGQTPEALRRMGEITGENILRCLRGEKPLHAAS
jgi:D-3-phosphoglycerate dehydrogenase